MLNKKTAAAVAVAVVFGMMAYAVTTVHVIMDTNGGESVKQRYLEQIRQQSILEGAIYDDELLRFDLIQAKIDHFGSVEAANAFYDDFNSLLKESQGNPGLEITNEGTMRLFNFDILVGEPVRSYEVAALVVGTQMAEGTYTTPIKPLQILHKWMLDKYCVHPGTASARLDQLVGDMRPLASEVLQIKETEALLNLVPGELKVEDSTYWAVVADYGHCAIVEKRTDCAQYLTEIEARAWEGPEPGFPPCGPAG